MNKSEYTAFLVRKKCLCCVINDQWCNISISERSVKDMCMRIKETDIMYVSDFLSQLNKPSSNNDDIIYRQRNTSYERQDLDLFLHQT